MLQQLSEQVRECLRRAAEAKAQADTISDPGLKRSYSDLEGSWLFLARSYMFSESVQDFIGHRPEKKELAQVDPRLPVVGQLFDLLPLAVYVCDASGIIVYYNAHAAKLWGRCPSVSDPADRFSGSCRMYRLDGGPIEHPHHLTAEVLQSGVAVQNREIVVERADGSHAVALANIHPFKDRMGNVLGAVNCFQDLSRRKRSERRITALVGEADRPTRNILAVLEGSKGTIEARIGTLGKVQALFAQSGGAGAELSSIATQQLAPYLRAGGRARVDGPDVLLAPNMAQAVALILHELTTNAAKHGSLSVSEGQIEVTWSLAGDGRLILNWMESGGPPAHKPKRESFGASIIDGLVGGLKGEIRRDWRAQGFACQIVLQLQPDGLGSAPSEHKGAKKEGRPRDPL